MENVILWNLTIRPNGIPKKRESDLENAMYEILWESELQTNALIPPRPRHN